ncbi:MAG: single-stranded DNA-binding protein [Clostridiales Family XIII bacterium]|nr:single-stranded DNA-binding protein [Clostridiales Family XIII bacterium]
MNSVNIIGRLTKDPEMRKSAEGKTICTLRLAIDDTFSKDDRADFISVTVFGNQGDNCEKYLRKGFITGVQGRLRSDSYPDSDGIKRYTVKINAERVQFLQWPERKERAAEAAAVAAPAAPAAAVAAPAPSGYSSANLLDDVGVDGGGESAFEQEPEQIEQIAV